MLMQCGVEERAAVAGVRVDTIRFYQARGLLSPPARRGRIALYGTAHLVRLREIQRLARGGFKLEQIAQLGAAARPTTGSRRGGRRAKRGNRAPSNARPPLSPPLRQRIRGTGHFPAGPGEAPRGLPTL